MTGSKYERAARSGIHRENVTEQVSFRMSKTDYALLMKLVEIKGSTPASLLREGLHFLFAHHGMLPEESTRMLLGQFVRDANKSLKLES